MDFEKLGLSQIYAVRLNSAGIQTATEIQVECFPSIVEGRSVMGLAKTGTGKTLAFLAPLVERLKRQAVSIPGSVVVLLPTRELALQVAESLQLLLQDPTQSSVMVGGQAEDQQLASARKAPWWIATPGRFLDLLRRRQLPKPAHMSCVVLDEADRLLDMGFLDDIRAIFKELPPSEQALFFSATLHFGVEEMAFELGFDFEKKGVAAVEATAENLEHSVVYLGEQEKFAFLVHFLQSHKELQAIIFSNYKDKARKLSARLRGLGARAECLNADLAQNRRIEIVEAFKSGKLQYLVASDLAARGIDILDLDLVVNFDLPEDPSIYVHRVGRTARAGKKGQAISFVGFEDSFRLERIEKYLGQKLRQEDVNPQNLSEYLPRWEGSIRPETSRPTVAKDRHVPERERPMRTQAEPRLHGPAREGPRKPVERVLATKVQKKKSSFVQTLKDWLWRVLGKSVGQNSEKQQPRKSPASHDSSKREGRDNSRFGRDKGPGGRDRGRSRRRGRGPRPHSSSGSRSSSARSSSGGRSSGSSK